MASAAAESLPSTEKKAAASFVSELDITDFVREAVRWVTQTRAYFADPEFPC